MLNQHRLRQILNYNPTTGIFTFVKGRRKGKIAGTAHDGRGFLKVSIDSQSHLLHRLAWLWMTGTMPRSNIDHINSNRGDNRWSNLREAERSQKRGHRVPWPEPTTTPGVWKVGEHFEAMVEVQGAMMNLGAFETSEEAVAAITKAHSRARCRLVQQRCQATQRKRQRLAGG